MAYKTRPEKILIVAPAWIGDLVMAQALCIFLKARNPNVIIDILALEHLRPLIERMPEINTIITTNFKHGVFDLNKRYHLGKKLRTANYAQAIILPNSFKSALIPFFAKIPLRTGWRGEMRYILLNDLRILEPEKIPLMVERFLALGASVNERIICTQNLYPKLITKVDRVHKSLQKFNLEQISDKAKKILALCVGAEYGSAKRWPAEYFAKVAATKIQEGWDVWLFGSDKDQTIAAEVIAACNPISHGKSIKNFAGKTNLGEAIDLLSLATIVITNDTGLMHIAAALDLPLIAIYGSSTPKFTPPLTNKARIVSLNLKCSPCFKRECPFLHLKCLTDLKPEKVLEVLNSINI